MDRLPRVSHPGEVIPGCIGGYIGVILGDIWGYRGVLWVYIGDI